MYYSKIITRLAIIAICCFGSINKSNAQLVTPSLPDRFWYLDIGYIAGINSAMIEFNDTLRNVGVRNWLAVEAYYGNNLEGGIAFTDINSGNTFHWDYGAPGLPYTTYIAGTPDIIVGNSATNPMGEYKVAAAYNEVVSGGPTLVLRYIIDYFTVSYTGSGVFTVTHTGSTVFPSSPTMIPYTIHLDVIAEAGNTTATGYPWCDKFVVTWDDLANGSIFAWQGSLNSVPPASLSNFAPGVTQIISGSPTPYYRPDVAGVQRRACPTCLVEDFALITYLGSNMTDLRYDEWNVTGSSVVTNPVWFTGGSLQWPRIDAPDDYNINDPAAGNAHFKICAWVNNILSYSMDPLLGIGNFFNNLQFTPLKNACAPAIAFGANNSQQYNIVQEADDPSVGVHEVYMVPIDWTNSLAMATAPGGGTNWFQINSTALGFMNGDFLTSVSTPCNNQAGGTLVSWSSHNQLTNVSTVSYKMSPYTGVGSGYSFRQGSVPEAATNAVPFVVKPNPTVAHLFIEAGHTGSYTITDMLGRTALQGPLTGEAQQIDVTALGAGNYIIKAGSQTGKFVKQ